MPRKLDLADRVSRLRSFLQQKKRLPGYNEMRELFDYRSKSAVFGLLRRLEREGYLSRRRGKVAATGRLAGSVRLLGTVQAGFPSPAEEQLLDTISLDEFLVERPDATFMLKVSGDSMQDAGIQPGDLVLVERGATPKSNDIVIAQVDGEWTMKYFVRDRGGVRLEAANAKYPPIAPSRSLEIAGVVRGVIRKYG
jgi:SOS regulatory protein LexA